ncbi:hypothetical protein HN51_007381 [Arachis hypogaea]
MFHPPECSSSVTSRTQCGRPLIPIAGVTVTVPKRQTSSINNWRSSLQRKCHDINESRTLLNDVKDETVNGYLTVKRKSSTYLFWSKAWGLVGDVYVQFHRIKTMNSRTHEGSSEPGNSGSNAPSQTELSSKVTENKELIKAELAFVDAIDAFREVSDHTNIILINCNLSHGQRALADEMLSKIENLKL